MTPFDDRICALGEGPLWHPERQQFFWFDILGHKLMTRTEDGPHEWQFDEHVSAAGWVDRDTLLIASETCLSRFDIPTGESEYLIGLESDTPVTRSNDGRADPFGGFWIGTMGKSAEPQAGAIYRYFDGQLETLYRNVSIPNAICFAPDKSTAFYADTAKGKVMRQELDAEGWPSGKPAVFIDLNDEGLNPDGAVIDSEGCMWLAQWGAARVARYDANGAYLSAVSVPASQSSCPAFGGDDLQTLFVTSAAHGVDGPQDGQTFAIQTEVTGQAEHQVTLD